MNDCLFCKIARGEIPSDKVFEDDSILAFRDIHPQAARHVLIIPKIHLSGLNGLENAGDALLACLLRAARSVAKEAGIDESGYRLVANCGKDACQSVQHLHFHLLGGEQLSEKMV